MIGIPQAAGVDFDLRRVRFRVDAPERGGRRHLATLEVEVGLPRFVAVGPRAVADVKEAVGSFGEMGCAVIIRSDAEGVGGAEPRRRLGPAAPVVRLAAEDRHLIGHGLRLLVALVGDHVQPALAVDAKTEAGRAAQFLVQVILPGEEQRRRGRHLIPAPDVAVGGEHQDVAPVGCGDDPGRVEGEGKGDTQGPADGGGRERLGTHRLDQLFERRVTAPCADRLDLLEGGLRKVVAPGREDEIEELDHLGVLEGHGGHLAMVGLSVDRQRPLQAFHGGAEGLLAMGPEKVRPGQRGEDPGNAFALRTMAGGALDAVEVGARGDGRQRGEQAKEEGKHPPHASIEAVFPLLSSLRRIAWNCSAVRVFQNACDPC